MEKRQATSIGWVVQIQESFWGASIVYPGLITGVGGVWRTGFLWWIGSNIFHFGQDDFIWGAFTGDCFNQNGNRPTVHVIHSGEKLLLFLLISFYLDLTPRILCRIMQIGASFASSWWHTAVWWVTECKTFHLVTWCLNFSTLFIAGLIWLHRSRTVGNAGHLKIGRRAKSIMQADFAMVLSRQTVPTMQIFIRTEDLHFYHKSFWSIRSITYFNFISEVTFLEDCKFLRLPCIYAKRKGFMMGSLNLHVTFPWYICKRKGFNQIYIFWIL